MVYVKHKRLFIYDSYISLFNVEKQIILFVNKIKKILPRWDIFNNSLVTKISILGMYSSS